jgi:hypothetical protein
VNKQISHRVHMDMFNLKKLKEVDVMKSIVFWSEICFQPGRFGIRGGN